MRHWPVAVCALIVGATLWMSSVTRAQDERPPAPHVCNDVEGQLVNGQVMPKVGRLVGGVLSFKPQEGAVVAIEGGRTGVMITKLAGRRQSANELHLAWQPGNIEPFPVRLLGLPLYVPPGRSVTLASSTAESDFVYFAGYEVE
jgi:hypothetical protein